MKCSQIGRTLSAQVKDLSREDCLPLSVKDLTKGSSLLLSVKGKMYPVEFIRYAGEPPTIRYTHTYIYIYIHTIQVHVGAC